MGFNVLPRNLCNANRVMVTAAVLVVNDIEAFRTKFESKNFSSIKMIRNLQKIDGLGSKISGPHICVVDAADVAAAFVVAAETLGFSY